MREMVMRPISESGKSGHRNCLTIEVLARKVRVAPRMITARRRDVVAACAGSALRWNAA